MGKEKWFLLQVEYMKDNGVKIKCQVKELFIWKMIKIK